MPEPPAPTQYKQMLPCLTEAEATGGAGVEAPIAAATAEAVAEAGAGAGAGAEALAPTAAGVQVSEPQDPIQKAKQLPSRSISLTN